MKFDKDSFSRITPPQIVLNKASGERLGIINPTALTLDKKLNEPDELAFTLYLYTNDERDPYYDYVEEMMYIEIPGEARYVITSIDIVSEGSRQEHKDVVCKSYEWMLGTRYLEDFVINTGETESTDGVDFNHLMSMCLGELFPEWSYDLHVSLRTVHRSFNVSRSSVYDFLMTEVAEAFECIFEFDSYNKRIYGYPQALYGVSSGVMVSYDNLLKTTNMSLNIEDIKTCLVLSGDEDVNVREINRSNDRIYNFEYFNSTEFMSQSLYDAYNAWQTLTYHTSVNWNYLNTLYDAQKVKYFVFSNTKDLHGNYVLNISVTSAEYNTFLTQNHLENNYNNAYTFLLNKYQTYYSDVADWSSNNMPAGNNKRYFGYGTFPVGYPNNIDLKSTDTFEIPRYTSVSVVTSLPAVASASTDILYLIKNDTTYAMYRKYNGAWLNTNNWSQLALAPLQEKLKSAEKNMATAMKNGYGSETPPGGANSSTTEKNRQLANYNTYYLPYVYAAKSLEKYVASCQTTVSNCQSYQSTISKALQGIANLTAMKNAGTILVYSGGSYTPRPANFTDQQLKELSTFIREDELTSSNYVVTDIMTNEERFSMLKDLLQYGTDELNKVAQPQMTFSADVVNLFGMPEFDRYSGYIDIGNTIVVYLRDDYIVKPRITNIHYNFYDESDFSLTFSNILKKSKEYWSDVQDVLNEASSISSSVSFNASYWSEQAKNADTISQHISAGLLAAGDFLKSGVDSELVMDSRGLFVNTVTGSYKTDSIFIGGGRILFTNDSWKTVKMSVGRATVRMPTGLNTDGTMKWTETSKFGVFADFLVAGYVAGSTIVGGRIYSQQYQTSSSVVSGNQGTLIDLDNGTFEFNSMSAGKKRLKLDSTGLKAYGKIYAETGHIGGNPNNPDDATVGFTITQNAIYSGSKDSPTSTNPGIFLSPAAIILGAGSADNAPFSVKNDGALRSTSGTIGGFTISNSALYTKDLQSVANNAIGLSTTAFSRALKIYGSKSLLFAIGEKFGIGTDGTVYLSGEINATGGYIGANAAGNTGFTIKNGKLYSNKEAIGDNAQTGVYVGTDGIGLGSATTYTDQHGNTSKHAFFEVDSSGNLWCQNANVTGRIVATSGTFKSINTPNISNWWIDEAGNLHAKNIYTNRTSDIYGDNKDIFDAVDSLGNGFKYFEIADDHTAEGLGEICDNLQAILNNWGTTSRPGFKSVCVGTNEDYSAKYYNFH